MSEIMSYSLKYYPDPGIAFDISKMLFFKLNPETTWKSLLTSFNYSTSETTLIHQNADIFPVPNNLLLLFSFIPLNRNETFLSYIIRNMICKDFALFSIDALIDNLSNQNNLSLELYSFYFGENSEANFDLEKSIRTNKAIPDKVKLLLFGYIMNPLKYIDILTDTIIRYNNIIRTLHKSHFCEFNITDDIIDSIIKTHYSSNDLLPNTLKDKTISFSICCTIPDYLCHFFDFPNPFLISALDTLSSYNPSSNSNNTSLLCSYTNVLSDQYRLSIIHHLLSHQSVTLQELSKLLCLSQTATYHHITLLRKTNMLSVSRNGRTVYYSYNPNGIDSLIKALSSIQAIYKQNF